MSNEAMIQLRQLKMAFGSKVILDNLDLDVRQGETLAVIGPSGTGKSTIIKLLTGLLPPTSGSIVIDGQEVSAFTEDEWDGLRQHMGVVFQYSALFDFLSVGENVAFGLRRHFKLPEEEITGARRQAAGDGRHAEYAVHVAGRAFRRYEKARWACAGAGHGASDGFL